MLNSLNSDFKEIYIPIQIKSLSKFHFLENHLYRYEKSQTTAIVGICWTAAVLEGKHPVQLEISFRVFFPPPDVSDYLVCWDLRAEYFREIFLERGVDGPHGVDLTDWQMGRGLLRDEHVHSVVRLLSNQDHRPDHDDVDDDGEDDGEDDIEDGHDG